MCAVRRPRLNNTIKAYGRIPVRAMRLCCDANYKRELCPEIRLRVIPVREFACFIPIRRGYTSVRAKFRGSEDSRTKHEPIFDLCCAHAGIGCHGSRYTARLDVPELAKGPDQQHSMITGTQCGERICSRRGTPSFTSDAPRDNAETSGSKPRPRIVVAGPVCHTHPGLNLSLTHLRPGSCLPLSTPDDDLYRRGSQ